MKNIAYYNGETGSPETLKIPMYDRVCFFGDGVYDACYSRNRKVFTLDEHVERLFSSAEKVGITIPLSMDKLCTTIISLVEECDRDEHFVYVQVTRGTAPRNHVYEKTKGNLWITVTQKNVTSPSKRFKIISVSDKRYGFCNVKTLNLLPNVLASQQAHELNCDEAVFHINGKVTECAHSNIHLLKNNVLYTSPCDEKILAGIARKHLINACQFLNVTVKEERFDLKDIPDCDELFITSAGTFCTPVISVDGLPCGGKNPTLTHALQDYLYSEFINATR